jgi:hypothetical protein
MSSAIDPSLEVQLRRLAETQPSVELSFIVTLVPGARASAVVPFTPIAEADVIHMVAGRMTARQALALGANEKVATIELDGEARALESLLTGRR